MAELTPDQLAFLRSQAIPLSLLFDASGMRKPDYQAAMKEAGKSFAYGVTACARGGHTLRTRAGHCIQCNTANIAYALRHEAPAYVYIAGSFQGRLLKIGSSGDLPVRRDLLNSYRYGGQRDWQMLAWAHTSSAGRVEFRAHDRLARFRVSGEYFQGGKRRRCYELFRCDFSHAIDALRISLPSEASLKIPHETRALQSFSFSEK